MKITFDLDKFNLSYTEFHSQEEWDANSLSAAGYDRAMRAPRWREDGTYISGPAIERYSREPERFPCICVETGWWSNSNGPDEVTNIFIYDYQLTEE